MVKDPNLRLVLAFGIGIHHAGLIENDRTLVERLFAEQKIQTLIATSTLAWGVNLPAHLVIVKGTEYFDGKQSRYVDFPITGEILKVVCFEEQNEKFCYCHFINFVFFCFTVFF